MARTRQMLVLALLAPLLLALSSNSEPCAQGLTTLLSQNWDSGTSGWTVQSTDSTYKWAADGTGSVTAYVSAPNSMNYNNGQDYGEGVTSSGSVTSPEINLTGTSSPKLTFSCNFETEDDTASGAYDTRSLQISSDNFATMKIDEFLGVDAAASVGQCGQMTTWHTHTVNLQPSWGKIRIRWHFDTVDDLLNDTAGWFIDNIKVEAVGGTPVVGGGTTTAPAPAPAPAGPHREGSDTGVSDRCSGSVAGTQGSWMVAALALALLVLFVPGRRV